MLTECLQEQAYKYSAIIQRGALNMFKVVLQYPHCSKLSSLKLNKVYKLSVWIEYLFYYETLLKSIGFISGDLCVYEFYLCACSTTRKANETIKKGQPLPGFAWLLGEVWEYTFGKSTETSR